jgi:hypothetical protein
MADLKVTLNVLVAVNTVSLPQLNAHAHPAYVRNSSLLLVTEHAALRRERDTFRPQIERLLAHLWTWVCMHEQPR